MIGAGCGIGEHNLSQHSVKWCEKSGLASSWWPPVEVYTARYEREHGHKPQGRRYWRFVLVSSSVQAGVRVTSLRATVSTLGANTGSRMI